MAPPTDDDGLARNHLLRLKVVSPLSLALAVLVLILLALLPNPTLGEISDRYLTILTPKKELIGIYWLAVFVLTLGYCIDLAVVSPPTPLSYVPAYTLPLLLVFLALWAPFFLAQLFVTSEVILLVSFFIALYANIQSYRIPSPSYTQYILARLPIKLFLIILLNVDIWQNGLLALRWYTYYPPPEDSEDPHTPKHLPLSNDQRNWIVFGVITLAGMIDAGVVFFGKDIAWAVGSLYIFIAILLEGGKPPQVFITLIVLAILQIVSLVASFAWHHVREKEKKKGPIALPDDEPDIGGRNEERERQGLMSGEDRYRGGEVGDLND